MSAADLASSSPPVTMRRAFALSPLLLASGFCALLEQVVWERELRLVFGVTTAAAAAVVAIFIGGLGLGSLWFGKRVDRHPRPLALYATLELGVAALVAATPLLLRAARWVYVHLGGTSALGGTVATLTRLLLAALVVGPPTLLMGGTLPAAARAVTTPSDDGRRATGWLYGINTVGAVAGALAATLFVVELLGNRLTLLLAAALAALVGMTARFMSRSALFVRSEERTRAADEPGQAIGGAVLPPWVVIVAAATSGFAFFVVELAAPRLLAPLLGGTVFTFGLVLAVALVGIGLGGLLYGSRKSDARPGALGVTFALEACAFALPLILGDGIALLALRLRPLHDFGFAGYACSAIIVTSLVLLPGALVAGYQFPLFIALLGQGRDGVGNDIGKAYAANTAGSMAGALAGGLVLMPALSAPGCLRAAAVLLAAAAIAVGLAAWLRTRAFVGALLATCAAAAAIAAVSTARGPTAVWRHGSIGAGRMENSRYATYNERRMSENEAREINDL